MRLFGGIRGHLCIHRIQARHSNSGCHHHMCVVSSVGCSITTRQAMTKLDRIRALCQMVIAFDEDERIPKGPWFVAGDRAEDTTEHRDAGLALVETGRDSDWFPARLCEWPTANFIAFARNFTPAAARALLVAITVLEGTRDATLPYEPGHRKVVNGLKVIEDSFPDL